MVIGHISGFEEFTIFNMYDLLFTINVFKTKSKGLANS